MTAARREAAWRRAAERVLAAAFGGVDDVVAHATWGATLVVEARTPAGGAVVLKASAVQDVLVESNAAQLARGAGAAVPEVLASGREPGLPGGKWFAMERARGVTWESLHEAGVDSRALLEDLAGHLARVHGLELPGFGWLDAQGRGRFGSWSEWLEHAWSNDLRRLERAWPGARTLAPLADAALRALAPELTRRRAGLLHGDLGDREVFVDAPAGTVSAIVDWGDAVVGDPLYELVRFVGGGPADDPRPARFTPILERAYTARTGLEAPPQLRALYRAHNAIRNAGWSIEHEPGWIPALVEVATTCLRTAGA